MNTQKFIVSGIVGGVVSFLVGWLIWGTLLMGYMKDHHGIDVTVNRTEMIWWALIAGNLFNGLTLSYIFNKWANITTISAGAMGGAVLGLLMGAAMDLSFYATTQIYSIHSMCADILGGIVASAIVGAAVGWANGWGKK